MKDFKENKKVGIFKRLYLFFSKVLELLFGIMVRWGLDLGGIYSWGVYDVLGDIYEKDGNDFLS